MWIALAMFQKEAPKNTVDVEILRADGKRFPGKLVVPYGSELVKVLNGGSRFIEFEDADGTPRYLAKEAVVELVEAKNKKPPKLHNATLDETQSAHRVLNVAANASHDEVRAAYARLAKRYHPDQYTTVELPSEVSNYMSRMFEHVSLAYQALTRRETVDAAE